jgi:hypothetical protein
MNEKGNRYAISALREKRATIASEIVQLERQVRHKREQLVHVDATLAILDPDADPSEIKPKRIVKHVNLFRSGELSRLIMTAFRESDGQPMSNREITEAVMRLHGIGPEARRAIQTRVRTSLAYQEKRGKVVKVGEGTGARWRLI